MKKYSLPAYSLLSHVIFLAWFGITYLAWNSAIVRSYIHSQQAGALTWLPLMTIALGTPLLTIRYMPKWREALEPDLTQKTNAEAIVCLVWGGIHVFGLAAVLCSKMLSLAALAGNVALAGLFYLTVDTINLTRRLKNKDKFS